jgi:hypothetical protein
MTQDIAIPKLTGQEDFRTWAVLLELVFTAKDEHIGVRFGYLKENMDKGEFYVQYCPTTEMTADIFTKPLGLNLFRKHRTALGMGSAPDEG